jgi:hypothetical protein
MICAARLPRGWLDSGCLRVIEKCLNHRMQGVMAVYNQHDYAEERIAAARLWSDALTRLVQE